MTGENNPAANAGTANNQNPPAGNNQQQQNQPANNQQSGSQQQPPQNEFIMNQEQFNKRWGEKMEELEKELGLQPGGLKTFIEERKKPKPAAQGEKLTGADLKLAKMTALMLAKVPSEKIPIALEAFNIAGNTSEEITASVQKLIDAKLLIIEAPAQQGIQQQQQNQAPMAAQGAGNTGVPGTPPGKKTWKASEIRNMSREDHIKQKDEIQAAMAEGRVIED